MQGAKGESRVLHDGDAVRRGGFEGNEERREKETWERGLHPLFVGLYLHAQAKGLCKACKACLARADHVGPDGQKCPWLPCFSR